MPWISVIAFFFFNDTATTEIYTLSLHDALPISLVIPAAWVLLLVVGLRETREQSWNLGWEIWALLSFATLGPLVLTNVLWFRSVHRIGAAKATLAANLQPFVAAVLAVILLSEPLGWVQ